MLILTRKPGQSIQLDLDGHFDAEPSVREAIGSGSIEVRVVRVEGSQVEIGIKANPRLQKGRGGLSE